MNKYFSLLGLREDAGKDDVKAAYARRVQKYKASDYDDDPEYVRKKLAELKTAYENAYRMAGNGSSSVYRRDDFDLPAASPGADSPGSRSAGARQQAHRRLHEQEEKEARQRRARKVLENESRKDKMEAEETGSLFRRPDLFSLRQKAENLRDDIKTQAGELKETVSGALNKDEDNAGYNTAPGSETPKLKPAAPKLADDTGGTVMETPSGARASNSADKEAPERSGKFISLVIAIIIALISGITQCGSNDYDYDYYDDYATTYSYSFDTEKDQIVFDTAIDSSDLLFDTGCSGDWTGTDYDDEMLQAEADQFARNYLDMDQLSDVCGYLYDTYGDFFTTADDSLDEQVEEVLAFYGFMRPDDALGYIDPYKEETITNAYEYLVYLNEYFEQNGPTVNQS